MAVAGISPALKGGLLPLRASRTSKSSGPRAARLSVRSARRSALVVRASGDGDDGKQEQEGSGDWREAWTDFKDEVKQNTWRDIADQLRGSTGSPSDYVSTPSQFRSYAKESESKDQIRRGENLILNTVGAQWWQEHRQSRARLTLRGKSLLKFSSF